MNRIIKHITEQLVARLPDDQPHYRLDELRTLGIPVFIVQRIQVELERNLAESMNRPQTEWANMESEPVLSAWEQFIAAIRQEARLPAVFAHSVMETAVADVLDMLVQPRKNLPEVIFGVHEELNYDQIVAQMNAVVVYRHFAQIIPRYMQKRGLQKLDRQRCAAIIEKADERLTMRYSPLNWAQMLEPLFGLLDQKIDSDLLRLFFEDKKMPKVARQFDLLRAPVDKARLIEILSSPESLNMAESEDEQSELFEGNRQQQDSAGKTEDNSIKKNDDSQTNLNRTKSGEHGSKATLPGRYANDPVVGAFHKFRENLKETEQKRPDAISRTITNSEVTEDDGERKAKAPELREEASLNDIFGGAGSAERPADRYHDTASPSEKPQQSKRSGALTGATDESKLDTSTDSAGKDPEEEVPMWKRFLSPEEVAALEEEEAREAGHPPSAYGVVESAGSNGPGDSAGAKIEELRKLMGDERDRFIRKIFRGSEAAYDESLVKVAELEDWRSASRYIDREVFKRNLVDMYSEAAVDYTDRLHTFFRRKSKP